MMAQSGSLAINSYILRYRARPEQHHIALAPASFHGTSPFLTEVHTPELARPIRVKTTERPHIQTFLGTLHARYSLATDTKGRR